MNQETHDYNLNKLKDEHRSLDQKIDEALSCTVCDQLAVQRMKKRKLQLKDQILTLEAQLASPSGQSSDQAALKKRLKKLREDHRKLDQQITSLLAQPIHNQLEAQHLKKRKLYLKEEILKIESMLLPDSLA